MIAKRLTIIIMLQFLLVETTIAITMDNSSLALKVSAETPQIYYNKPGIIKEDVTLAHLAYNINKPIRFKDLIFEGRVDFSNKNFTEEVRFENVTFKNKADFTSSIFCKGAIFSNSKFFGDSALFDYTIFSAFSKFDKTLLNNITFSEAKFLTVDFSSSNLSNISFERSIFKNPANFLNCIFNNSTTFDLSQFEKFANFEGAIFGDDVTFKSVNFLDGALFRNAKFLKAAAFQNSKFNSSCDFLGSKFEGNADFNSAKFLGEAKYDDSIFNGTSNFFNSQFNSEARFAETKFKGSCIFNKCKFDKDIYFRKSIFNGDARFQEAQFKGDADFFGAEFNGYADFYDVLFSGDALFEGGVFTGSLNFTRTKYQRIYMRMLNINELEYSETAYKLLIENFKNIGFFDDANKCYYRFMWHYAYTHLIGLDTINKLYIMISKAFEDEELHSNIIANTFLSTYYFFSWIFYGFGTEPVLALIWSILLIGFFSAFWYQKQRTISEKKHDEYSLEFYTNQKTIDLNLKAQLIKYLGALSLSTAIFLSGTKFFIDPPEISKEMERSSPWVSRVFKIERFLGGFFSILFFISIGSVIFSF